MLSQQNPGEPRTALGVIKDPAEPGVIDAPLVRSEEFNRSLMEATSDCIKVLDLEGRLLHMNTHGLTAMEIDDFSTLAGQKWEGLWPQEARHHIVESVIRAARGEASSFQAFGPTAKGAPKWWDVTVTPVRDSIGGQVVQLLSITRDITERKHADDSIRASQLSEQKYRNLFDSLMEGYCLIEMIYDASGRAHDYRFLEVNRAFKAQTGVPSVKGYTIRGLIPNIELKWIEIFAKVAETGESVRFDMESPTLKRWLDVQGYRLNEDGSKKVAIVFNDITGRKKIERALQESHERYRAAMSAVSDVVWTNNAKGLMQGEQPGWAEFTGQSFEDYQGYGWSKAVHPDDAQPTIEAWNLAVAEKRTAIFEHRLRRRDGQWRLCSVRAVPIFNGDGTIREWVGVHTDITARKRDEEKLQLLSEELAEASHRKDEFLATLAHELRNPLAPIRNGLKIITMSAGKQANVAQASAMMERQLAQMVRLVDDLMDISRITRGIFELRKEPVSLTDVLNSAIETSRPLITQMGHELTVTLPEQPILVDADFTRLAQAFLNLLNNAAKYSERDGRIQLRLELEGDYAVVTVKDSGIGIAADQLPKIFDMFTQVDQSLDKSQGGLGIGLTLVKRLVKMHDGVVEAYSPGLGKGSEFVVRLPCVTQTIGPQKTVANHEPGGSESSFRILIVDDNRDGADSLSEMLNMEGHRTCTAYDGHEGVAAADAYRPDVVLLDIGLPNLNGYEVCRMIRKQPWGQNMKVIALTGWGQEDDRRRSQEAGFDEHLVKPVDPTALMKMLREPVG